MNVQASDHGARFADRVAAMLERVEHRPAISQADRDAAYRLRYEAYLRQNLLSQRPDVMLYDEVYDESPNSLTTLTYIDGELASTVRVHVVNDTVPVSPALDVFRDVLEPRLKGHRIMIDPSRLAADAEMARKFPELPYFAIRPPWMAARHFNADFCVVSCATGHVGYYRRTFRAEVWSGLRSYPKVNAQVVCVGYEFAAEADQVEARYPSFRSTRNEREVLFGDFALALGAVETPLRRVAAAAAARA